MGLTKRDKIKNKDLSKRLLDFHGISYDEYNNGSHWILDTVERIDLWPSTLKFKINDAYGEGLDELDLFLEDTSGKLYKPIKEELWKSVNAELEQRKLSETKLNTVSVGNVGEHSMLRKKNTTKQLKHKPKRCLIQPLEGAVFYDGNEPPWR